MAVSVAHIQIGCHGYIKKLSAQGLETYAPNFPIGVGYQNYENWSRLLKIYFDARLITKGTTIFAHSIAPVFICKFLIKNKIKVKKLIFICGFNNYFGIDKDYDEVNHSMYLDNLADVKNFCDEIICFYSDNDPYVKYDIEKISLMPSQLSKSSLKAVDI